MLNRPDAQMLNRPDADLGTTPLGSLGSTPTPPPGSTLRGCTGTTPTPLPGSTLRGSGGSTLRWSGGSTERPKGVGGHFGTTLASTSGFTSAEVVCVFAPSSSPSFVALWLVVVTTVIAGNPKAVTPLLLWEQKSRANRVRFPLSLSRRFSSSLPFRRCRSVSSQASDVSLLFAIRSLRRACML